jgi:hypothetical protein
MERSGTIIYLEHPVFGRIREVNTAVRFSQAGGTTGADRCLGRTPVLAYGGPWISLFSRLCRFRRLFMTGSLPQMSDESQFENTTT